MLIEQKEVKSYDFRPMGLSVFLMFLQLFATILVFMVLATKC